MSGIFGKNASYSIVMVTVKEQAFLDKISEITQKADLRASHITVNEASQLFNATRATNKLPGSLAEGGVYRGGTAKIIYEAKGDRPLYLFDTFEGLPEAEQRKRRWVFSRRSAFLCTYKCTEIPENIFECELFQRYFPLYW